MPAIEIIIFYINAAFTMRQQFCISFSGGRKASAFTFYRVVFLKQTIIPHELPCNFIFYLYIYPPDSHESDAIHRASNYPDLGDAKILLFG